MIVRLRGREYVRQRAWLLGFRRFAAIFGRGGDFKARISEPDYRKCMAIDGLLAVLPAQPKRRNATNQLHAAL